MLSASQATLALPAAPGAWRARRDGTAMRGASRHSSFHFPPRTRLRTCARGVKEQPHERRFLLTTLMVGLPLDKHHPARCELARSRAEVLAVAPLVGLAISDGLHNAGTTSSFLIDARPSVDSLWTSGV